MTSLSKKSVLYQNNLLICPEGNNLKKFHYENEYGYPYTGVFKGHDEPVECCEIFQNKLISGSQDGTLKLWDIESTELVRTFYGHKSYVFCCCCVSENGNFVSGSADLSLKLWDIETGEVLRNFENAHTNYVLCCCFVNDNVISGSADGTLKLWDIETTELIRTFTHEHEFHQNEVQDCCITLDGKLISCDTGGYLYLWDISAGTLERDLFEENRPCFDPWIFCFANTQNKVVCVSDIDAKYGAVTSRVIIGDLNSNEFFNKQADYCGDIEKRVFCCCFTENQVILKAYNGDTAYSGDSLSTQTIIIDINTINSSVVIGQKDDPIVYIKGYDDDSDEDEDEDEDDE